MARSRSLTKAVSVGLNCRILKVLVVLCLIRFCRKFAKKIVGVGKGE